MSADVSKGPFLRSEFLAADFNCQRWVANARQKASLEVLSQHLQELSTSLKVRRVCARVALREAVVLRSLRSDAVPCMNLEPMNLADRTR